ncbi:IMPACT family protein [Hufsiella arboris]|nr:YigZ family protein [Hufsiella arboris]
MLFEDTYKTIASVSEGIFRDKGSKFIGFAYPVKNELEAREILKTLRSLHPKANHHCWALRLSPDRSIFKFNDDGEPSGTAGRPILNTLLSNDLTNVLVVVVRYFGGTLLGVPGLINAYKNATTEALKSAQTIEKTVNDRYRINFSYDRMNDVMKLLKDEDLSVINPAYSSECSLETEIRKSRINSILSRLEKLEDVKAQYLTTC